MADLTVTSAAEWRKPRKEGYAVKFPSGNVAKIRPVGYDVFLHSARLPDTLTPIIARMMGIGKKSGANGAEPEPEPETPNLEELKANILLLNEVAKCVLLEPECVDNPENENQISPDDIEFQDKQWLLGFLNQPAQVLARFREGQAEDVGRLDHEQSDGGAPVEPAQDQEVVPPALPVG